MKSEQRRLVSKSYYLTTAKLNSPKRLRHLEGLLPTRLEPRKPGFAEAFLSEVTRNICFYVFFISSSFFPTPRPQCKARLCLRTPPSFRCPRLRLPSSAPRQVLLAWGTPQSLTVALLFLSLFRSIKKSTRPCARGCVLHDARDGEATRGPTADDPVRRRRPARAAGRYSAAAKNELWPPATSRAGLEGAVLDDGGRAERDKRVGPLRYMRNVNNETNKQTE